jgi:hypothetical protein
MWKFEIIRDDSGDASFQIEVGHDAMEPGIAVLRRAVETMSYPQALEVVEDILRAVLNASGSKEVHDG